MLYDSILKIFQKNKKYVVGKTRTVVPSVRRQEGGLEIDWEGT